MNYEEKYKQALERARDVYTYYCDDTEQLRKIESIFPELKESEDEKIRKEIVDFIISANKYGTNERCEEWLAWLEKQSKKLNADKVVEWLENYQPSAKLVAQFKRNFGL